MYYFLAAIFFISILLFLVTIIAVILKLRFWENNKFNLSLILISWFSLYLIFIIFFTGPTEAEIYHGKKNLNYYLPWKSGDKRFVAQGIRSFGSHRGLHTFAWDFVMPIGTSILAAREGRVIEIVDQLDGIGPKSNYIYIEQPDKTVACYAHIKKNGALVKVGDYVKRGQEIAKSGMVGQTFFPHLHFYVLNQEMTLSMPISFRDISIGVPLAGKFYTSQNELVKKTF